MLRYTVHLAHAAIFDREFLSFVSCNAYADRDEAFLFLIFFSWKFEVIGPMLQLSNC